MTSWAGTITLSEDDARANDGVLDFTTTASGSLSTTNFGFFRIGGIPVPQGATIVSATLAISAIYYSSGELTLSAVQSDDVPVLVPGLETNLGPPSPIYSGGTGSTQDVTSLVQLVVERPGWVAGNAMAFVAQRSSSTSSVRFVDGSPSYGATLTIEYEEGAPPGVQLAKLEVTTVGAQPSVKIFELGVFTDAPEPVAGPAKVWTGDQWAEAIPHVWSGDQWVPAQPYVWTGDQWAPTT